MSTLTLARRIVFARSTSRARLANMSLSSVNLESGTGKGPVEATIRTKLMAAFQPEVLNISNDSWQHRHHAAMKTIGGGNGETHFALEIVSTAFEGKPTIQRHRLVYAALDEELKNGVHALQVKARTPSEISKSI